MSVISQSTLRNLENFFAHKFSTISFIFVYNCNLLFLKINQAHTSIQSLLSERQTQDVKLKVTVILLHKSRGTDSIFAVQYKNSRLP